MITVAIITGCRKTFKGTADEFPCYIKETAESIHNSDIPLDKVTVYLDTLKGKKLDNQYLECLDNINLKVVKNKGGGIIENVKDVFTKNKDNQDKYLLLLEDDVLVNPNIYQETIKLIEETNLQFGSLYNVWSEGIKEMGYNNFWGGQALLMQTQDLAYYKDNFNTDYIGYPDIQLSRLAGEKLGYNIYIKGLVQHIGKISGHGNVFHKTNIW
jgi:hypothetical protein